MVLSQVLTSFGVFKIFDRLGQIPGFFPTESLTQVIARQGAGEKAQRKSHRETQFPCVAQSMG